MTSMISSPHSPVTGAAPRFATPRDLSRRTIGGGAAAVARALGADPHPWQTDAWDVAGEVLEDPESPLGYRMAYPVVCWIVPRRAGKSLGVLATGLSRLATLPLYRARYTAQTRQDAAAVLKDEWLPMVQRSPLSRLYTGRLSNGDERIKLPRNGSQLTVMAPRAGGGVGQYTDLGVIDEAWAFSALQGDAMEGGLRPQMKTRPAPQLWIVSSAGRADSTYLARWRDLGRAGTPGLAYVEYSADPDVDDLDDPATLERVHPAIGRTIRLDDVLGDVTTMGRAEYLRHYLGVWPDSEAVESVIPPAEWAAGRIPEEDRARLDVARPRPSATATPPGSRW
jgi:hypothetical protein